MSKDNYFKNSYKNRFKKKTTNQKNSVNFLDKNAPIIYCNHSTPCEIDSRLIYPNIPFFYQAAFIDPGTVSCAIRIVRYYVEQNKIDVLWFGIHNFGTEISQLMENTGPSLNPIMEKLKYCHNIIIERQFKDDDIKVVNYRGFQHIITYIQDHVKDCGFKPVIIEVDVGIKTTFLGGPANRGQNGGVKIKEWSKKFARMVCISRCDYISLAIINSSCNKQEEDLSDVLCYEYAWWRYRQIIMHLWVNKK